MNKLTQDRIPSLIPHSQWYGENGQRHHHRHRRHHRFPLFACFVVMLLIDKRSCVRLSESSVLLDCPKIPFVLSVTSRHRQMECACQHDDRNNVHDDDEG